MPKKSKKKDSNVDSGAELGELKDVDAGAEPEKLKEELGELEMKIAVMALLLGTHLEMRDNRFMAAVARHWTRNPAILDDRTLARVRSLAVHLTPHVTKYKSLAEKIAK
jgi:hypothetical protein